MMWELRDGDVFVSERDESGRYGVLYTGKAVTNTQARRSYEGFPYYGFVSRDEALPSATRDGNKVVSWGTLEEAMNGVEGTLARWRDNG